MDFSIVKEVINPSLSEQENKALIAIPEHNEIEEDVFQLDPLKSLGPDGYPAKFYQHIWEDVGEDIINIIH